MDGSGNSGGPPVVSIKQKIYTLEAEHELRLEINSASASSASGSKPSLAESSLSSAAFFSAGSRTGAVTVTLLSGTAELFGSELGRAPVSQNHQDAGGPRYTLLPPAKVAVFTWHGCEVSVEGDPDVAYVGSGAPEMICAVNCHAQLEVLRDLAVGSQSQGCGGPQTHLDGPRVLVAGPCDSGKSTLVRILASYAVRVGRRPLYVDLDCGQGGLGVPPGTVGAAALRPVRGAASPEGPAANAASCSVWWTGSADMRSNPDLYREVLVKLAGAVDARLRAEDNQDERSSGILVNTCGWIEGTGYDLLLQAIQALKADVVLVTGHDRLYSTLTSHFQEKQQTKPDAPPPPKIIKMPRSGGVVARDVNFRREARGANVRRYFYGEVRRGKDGQLLNQFTPTLLELPFASLTVLRLSNVSLSTSLLPVQQKQTTHPIALTEVDFQPSLRYAVLAVCHPSAVAKYQTSKNDRDLYLNATAGFVVVEKVDMERQILGMLSPCAGNMPSSTLILGDVNWVE